MRNGYHPNLTFNTDLEKWKYDKFNKFLTQHPELYLSYLEGMGEYLRRRRRRADDGRDDVEG